MSASNLANKGEGGDFAALAAAYMAAGYWPRRVRRGTRACYDEKFQLGDPDQPSGQLERWIKGGAGYGIALLMGSPFPDGTRLGAFDVDRNDYVALARVLLNNPVCGRFGSKGAAFFVRVRGDLPNTSFHIRDKGGKKVGQVVDCLFSRKICVIPPTLHPKTGEAYRWIGKPLLQTHFSELPIIEA